MHACIQVSADGNLYLAARKSAIEMDHCIVQRDGNRARRRSSLGRRKLRGSLIESNYFSGYY